MKNKLLNISLILVFIGILVCGVIMYASGNTARVHKRLLENGEFDKVTDNLYVAQGVAQESVDIAKTYIEMAPMYLWNLFAENGGTIHIVNNLQKDILAGTTYISNDGKVLDIMIRADNLEALYHELFHYYLRSHQEVLEDFEDIWKEEADACIREYLKGSSEESMRYFIDNEEEYLCELFKIQYFIGEEDASGKCPKSWEYMHEIIEDLYY